MDIKLDRKFHINIGGLSTNTITSGIVENSMSLSQILCSQDNLRFGECNASKFEVTINTAVSGISPRKGQQISVYITGAYSTAIVGYAIVNQAVVHTSERVPEDDESRRNYIFTGIIDSVKRDRPYSETELNDFVHITAYDVFYTYTNTNLFSIGYYSGLTLNDWWQSFVDVHSSGMPIVNLKTLRERLCAYMGLTIANSSDTFTNDSANIIQDFVDSNNTQGYTVVDLNSGITITQMLSWICELQCIFPHIIGDGRIEFIDIGQTAWKDIVGWYETDTSEFEETPVPAFTQVILSLGGKDNYTSGATATNPDIIVNNYLIMSSASAHDRFHNPPISDVYFNNLISTCTNNIYNYIDTYLPQYYVGSVSMIYSWLDIGLGEFLAFPEYGDEMILVTSNELSGPLLVDQVIESRGAISESTTSSDYYETEVIYDNDIQPYLETNDALSAVSVPTGTATNVGSIKLSKGKWVVSVSAQFASNSSGYRQLWISNTEGGSSRGIRYRATQAAVSGAVTVLHIVFLIEITASSATYYIVAQQNSSATLSVTPRYAIFGNKETN